MEMSKAGFRSIYAGMLQVTGVPSADHFTSDQYLSVSDHSAYDAASDSFYGSVDFNPDANRTPSENCCGGTGGGLWTFSLSPLIATIQATDPTAIEADANGNPVNGNFGVILGGPAEGNVTVPVRVDRTLADAANPGSDYSELSTSVSIAAGDTYGQVAVAPLPVNKVQPTKYVGAFLDPGDADVITPAGVFLAEPVGPRSADAVVQVLNTDVAVSVKTISDAHTSARQSAIFTFTRRSEGDLPDGNVYFTLTGSAIPGTKDENADLTPVEADYIGADPADGGSGVWMVHFGAGENSASIALMPESQPPGSRSGKTIVVTIVPDPAGLENTKYIDPALNDSATDPIVANAKLYEMQLQIFVQDPTTPENYTQMLDLIAKFEDDNPSVRAQAENDLQNLLHHHLDLVPRLQALRSANNNDGDNGHGQVQSPEQRERVTLALDVANTFRTSVGPLIVTADETAGTVTITLPRNANNDASVNQIDVTGRLLDINSNVKMQIAGGIILGNETGPVVVTLTPVGPVTDEDGNPITGFLEVFVSYQLKGSDGREIDGGTIEATVDLTLREN